MLAGNVLPRLAAPSVASLTASKASRAELRAASREPLGTAGDGAGPGPSQRQGRPGAETPFRSGTRGDPPRGVRWARASGCSSARGRRVPEFAPPELGPWGGGAAQRRWLGPFGGRPPAPPPARTRDAARSRGGGRPGGGRAPRRGAQRRLPGPGAGRRRDRAADGTRGARGGTRAVLCRPRPARNGCCRRRARPSPSPCHPLPAGRGAGRAGPPGSLTPPRVVPGARASSPPAQLRSPPFQASRDTPEGT